MPLLDVVSDGCDCSRMRLPTLVVVPVGAVLLFTLGSCGEDEPKPVPGEAATWEVDPERPPQKPDSEFVALVSRVECANGRTGRVLAPVIAEDDERVVVTYFVERTPDGDASCPGNNLVTQTVRLENPVGDRPLFDGSCPPPMAECEPRQRWPLQR